MKHVVFQPVARSTVSQSPQNRSFSKPIFTISTLFVIGSIGFGLTALLNPIPSDRLTDDQKVELRENFSQVLPIAIEQIQDYKKVLDAMPLNSSSRETLKTALDIKKNSSNTTSLAWVVLWDFATEDGDAVNLSSAGYEIVITLSNKPTPVAIPVDANHAIQLTGISDGGGGITVGIKSDTNNISLPILPVGEVLRIPVRL